MIQVKRVYDPINARDGKRFLVERLWPRGVKKEDFRFADWLKQVAPSPQLREWFAHDPAKWEEFRVRYYAELQSHFDALQPLFAAARRGNITLLFSARDVEYNNAVALKEYLDALDFGKH